MRNLPDTFTAHATFEDAVEAQDARVDPFNGTDPRIPGDSIDPCTHCTPPTPSTIPADALVAARRSYNAYQREYPAIARAEALTARLADARRAELDIRLQTERALLNRYLRDERRAR